MGRVFDPEKLHEIATACKDLPFDDMVERTTALLADAYPKWIDPGRPWLFNRAAGATGMMKLLHGSLSEYVIIFGSATGTEGHSGRYWMDCYDFMMAGRQHTYREDDPGTHIITDPPDFVYLPRSTAKGYRIESDTWMLEYGRGPIPTVLLVGLSDTILSSRDWRTFWKTLWHYGALVVRNLLRGKV